jgi:hypothetical protein
VNQHLNKPARLGNWRIQTLESSFRSNIDGLSVLRTDSRDANDGERQESGIEHLHHYGDKLDVQRRPA